MGMIQALLTFFRALVVGHAALAAENLALRQQLGVLQRSVKRPKLRRRDRIFWVWLSKLWPGWRSALAIVGPETVIRRHIARASGSTGDGSRGAGEGDLRLIRR